MQLWANARSSVFIVNSLYIYFVFAQNECTLFLEYCVKDTEHVFIKNQHQFWTFQNYDPLRLFQKHFGPKKKTEEESL